MDLKDFVKKVLSEITEATDEATNDKYKFVLADRDGKGVFFDMAVSVSDQNSKSRAGKGGIKVASILEAGGSGGTTKTTSKENTTRIQFNVGYRDLIQEQKNANLTKTFHQPFDGTDGLS